MVTLTQAGIVAYKTGDKVKAQSLFKQATKQNDQDIQAWLGLAATSSAPEIRLNCFVHVLHLDANNAIAMKSLARMVAKDEATIQIKKDANLVKKNKKDNPIIFQVRPSMALMNLRAAGLLSFVGLIAIFSFTSDNFLTGLLILVSSILLILSLLAILYAILTYRATQYTLTTQHLIVSDGLLNRTRKAIPIQRIQDVAFHQSWQERLLGLGHVVVESAGEFGGIKLRDLTDSQKRADQILQVINHS